jgi:hypothetical protein
MFGLGRALVLLLEDKWILFDGTVYSDIIINCKSNSSCVA